ncbi:MAG: hypothetical protein ACLFUB_02310 [Cyclobacteriaceae bacterium]
MSTDKERREVQEKLSKLWDKHHKTAKMSDEGHYISLENINLSDHGLNFQDFNAPGNLSLSPTSTTRHDNYFLRGFQGGNLKLFRNRNVDRNI